MRISYIPLAVLAAGLLAAGPTHAFHNKTPSVVPITTEGDADLPRVPSQGRRSVALVVPDGGGTKVISISPHQTGSAPTVVFAGGDNRNSVTSGSGKVFAWDSDQDPLGSGTDGRQIFMFFKDTLTQVTFDDSGTSANPDLDNSGRVVVFESAGDLAGIPNGGARQIFMRDKRGNTIQLTTGQGDSRNPMISRKRKAFTFESSSDPTTGDDTGVSQIFVGRYDRPPFTQITNGAAASRNPSFSDDGRIVTFESLADLSGSAAHPGVPQIFIYDTRTEMFAQVTDDAGGCTRPGVHRRGTDWRVTFVCGNEAQFFMLDENARYRVQTPGGDTQSILPELGSWFVMVSTTANLVSGGTTAGHQVYMINLYTRPAEPIPGTATWFPFQGTN